MDEPTCSFLKFLLKNGEWKILPYNLSKKGEITIGSGNTDVRLRINCAPLVCRIEVDENGWATLINESTEVKLNSKRASKKVILNDGDKIEIGNKTFVYSNPDKKAKASIPKKISSSQRHTIVPQLAKRPSLRTLPQIQQNSKPSEILNEGNGQKNSNNKKRKLSLTPYHLPKRFKAAQSATKTTRSSPRTPSVNGTSKTLFKTPCSPAPKPAKSIKKLRSTRKPSLISTEESPLSGLQETETTRPVRKDLFDKASDSAKKSPSMDLSSTIIDSDIEDSRNSEKSRKSSTKTPIRKTRKGKEAHQETSINEESFDSRNSTISSPVKKFTRTSSKILESKPSETPVAKELNSILKDKTPSNDYSEASSYSLKGLSLSPRKSLHSFKSTPKNSIENPLLTGTVQKSIKKISAQYLEITESPKTSEIIADMSDSFNKAYPEKSLFSKKLTNSFANTSDASSSSSVFVENIVESNSNSEEDVTINTTATSFQEISSKRSIGTTKKYTTKSLSEMLWTSLMGTTDKKRLKQQQHSRHSAPNLYKSMSKTLDTMKSKDKSQGSNVAPHKEEVIIEKSKAANSENKEFSKTHSEEGINELPTKLLNKPQSSPKNDLTKVAGVSRLFKLQPRAAKKVIKKTPKPQKSPKNDLRQIGGLRQLFSPKEIKSPKNDLTKVAGVSRLFKVQPRAVKKVIKKTPKPQKSPKNDLRDVRGLRRLLSPKEQKSPKNDLSKVAGVSRLFKQQPKAVKKVTKKTPKPQKSPKNDLRDVRGLRRLLSPKEQKSPKNDLSKVAGVSRLFKVQPRAVKKVIKKTPKPQKSPKNDLRDVRGLRSLLSPKEQKSPKNDLSKVAGVSRIFKQQPKAVKKGTKKTPKPQNSPKNDLRDVRGLRRLLSPKEQKSPKNDLSKVAGVSRLFKQQPKAVKKFVRRTVRPQKSPRNDLTRIAGISRLYKIQQQTKRKIPKAKKIPKLQTSPKNDLTKVEGLRRIFSPMVQKSPENNLSNVSGVRELFEDNEEIVKSKENVFDELINKKPLKTYKRQSHSLSPNLKRTWPLSVDSQLNSSVKVWLEQVTKTNENDQDEEELDQKSSRKRRGGRAKKIEEPKPKKGRGNKKVEEINENTVTEDNESPPKRGRITRKQTKENQEMDEKETNEEKKTTRGKNKVERSEPVTSTPRRTRRGKAADIAVDTLNETEEEKPKRGRRNIRNKSTEQNDSPPKRGLGRKKPEVSTPKANQKVNSSKKEEEEKVEEEVNDDNEGPRKRGSKRSTDESEIVEAPKTRSAKTSTQETDTPKEMPKRRGRPAKSKQSDIENEKVTEEAPKTGQTRRNADKTESISAKRTRKQLTENNNNENEEKETPSKFVEKEKNKEDEKPVKTKRTRKLATAAEINEVQKLNNSKTSENKKEEKIKGNAKRTTRKRKVDVDDDNDDDQDYVQRIRTRSRK